MRRIAFVFSVLLLLSLGAMVGNRSARADRSPDADSAGETTSSTGFPGATVEPLAGGSPAEAAGYSLALVRVTLAPGTSLPPLQHPGTVAAYVESGAFAVTVLTGEFDIARSGTGEVETATLGRETVLHAGDSAIDRGSVHSGRNPGETPTVLLISGLIVDGQPFVVPVLPSDASWEAAPSPHRHGEPY